MLIPLTRQTFEQLIPAVATGDQYRYYWGKFPDLLKRLLISAVAALVITLINLSIDQGLRPLLLIIGIICGLYWFWFPAVGASFKNLECRRYQYCGFWQGRVLDVYITEELVGQEESVNRRGELIIVDSLEKRLNVEVGDDTGFYTQLQVPLNRSLQGITRGQAALMIVMSNQKNLSRISKCSDIYIPSRDIWVSNYPYLRRDVFVEVARQLRPKKNKRTISEMEETRVEEKRNVAERRRPRRNTGDFIEY